MLFLRPARNNGKMYIRSAANHFNGRADMGPEPHLRPINACLCNAPGVSVSSAEGSMGGGPTTSWPSDRESSVANICCDLGEAVVA
jgi:hypothetical protein